MPRTCSITALSISAAGTRFTVQASASRLSVARTIAAFQAALKRPVGEPLAAIQMRDSWGLKRDGSEIPVRFAAKANAPWPGSHASLLVPADDGHDDHDLDIDRALVDAGFVAKYAAG